MSARRPADPSRAALASGGPGCGRRDRGDIELFAASAALRPHAPIRRHHRHQRQVDHHRADRARAAPAAGLRAQMAATSAPRPRRWRPAAGRGSTCWSCRPTRSTWRRPSRPTVAVLLNVSPDHLDRHGTMEHYAGQGAAGHQRAGDFAVIGIDDEGMPQLSAARRGEAASRVTSRSASPWRGAGRPRGSVEPDPRAEWRRRRGRLRLDGPAAARPAQPPERGGGGGPRPRRRPPTSDRGGACPFPGLPHRMEVVGGAAVRFVNDSKATNADAPRRRSRLLRAHPLDRSAARRRPAASTRCAAYFPKIEKAYLIGAATDEFARTLEGQVPDRRCGTLEEAVARAAERRTRRLRAGRAAVAGLRVLRPVSELRGARRPLPRPRPGACRACKWPNAGAMSHDVARGTTRWSATGGGRSTARPRRARVLMLAGPAIPDGRRAAGRRAARPVDLPLRQPPGAVPAPGAFLIRVSSCRSPRRGAGLFDYAVGMALMLAASQVRAGDQGRAALAVARGAFQHPAVRVRQARLRGARRLGFSEGAGAATCRARCSPSCCCLPPSCL